VADLTKEEDMKRAVAEAIEKIGGLDILVNRYECNSSAICLQSLGKRLYFTFPRCSYRIMRNKCVGQMANSGQCK
jgi:hypothetical protein